MKTLKIVWQRLVNEAGSTCPRCQGTHEEIENAVHKLQAALSPLGMKVKLETQTISQTEFLDQPYESNRIWIDGKPIEEWLGATAGSSPCCNECGDNDCRTMEVDNQTYEVIPEDLLIKAGLVAASQIKNGPEPTTQSYGCACSGSKCC